MTDWEPLHLGRAGDKLPARELQGQSLNLHETPGPGQQGRGGGVAQWKPSTVAWSLLNCQAARPLWLDLEASYIKKNNN